MFAIPILIKSKSKNTKKVTIEILRNPFGQIYLRGYFNKKSVRFISRDKISQFDFNLITNGYQVVVVNKHLQIDSAQVLKIYDYIDREPSKREVLDIIESNSSCFVFKLWYDKSVGEVNYDVLHEPK
jgi:hypothetical protein